MKLPWPQILKYILLKLPDEIAVTVALGHRHNLAAPKNSVQSLLTASVTTHVFTKRPHLSTFPYR